MYTTTFTRDDENATLTIERRFPASRDRVWEAITDPEILDRWWAPSPWRTRTVSMDFRVGGSWHYSMNGPDGERHFCRMDYLEIEPRHRIRSSDVFEDDAGNTDDSLPRQVMDMRIVDADGETELVTVVQYANPGDLQTIIDMGMREGLSTAYDQLETLLR